MKKFFALVLALVMAMSVATVAWGVDDATKAVQDALDAATSGTTIQLEAGVNYGTLYIRPTKSNGTVMYCSDGGLSDTNIHEYTTTNAAEFIAHRAETGYHYTPDYTTTLSNVTIVGAEGATVAGFVITSGHKVGPAHDYVLDKDCDAGSAYYSTLYISNLTFKNVNFTGKVDINTSDADTAYDGVTFDGCTFTTGGTASSNGQAIRYYNESNNGNVKNIVVNDCTFTTCYQGVYVQNVNGITVTDSTFNTTGHNAIAMQGTAVDLKNVVIAENTFNNIGDRVIRFGGVGADSNIAINNNIMENCGDENGELIKPVSVENGATVNLESNYWAGNDVSTAVVGFTAPTTAGITGGTWDTDVSAYLAAGYELFDDGNGNFTAEKAYNISFNTNGGSGSMADVTVAVGEYTLPANGFTAPEGKQFKGWSVNGVEKKVGDKITITADTEVKALWKSVGGGYYVPVSPSTNQLVQSADTFDGGIALAVSTSLLSVTGSALLLRKRED